MIWVYSTPSTNETWKAISSDVHLKQYSVILMSTFIYRMLVDLVREGDGTPLQYSCLENPVDGGAWWAAVHEVTQSQTLLSNFTFTFHFHALKKEMATHSSVLAWRIPGTVEPGGLPSMWSHRVGHDWSDLAAAAVHLVILILILRKEFWQSTTFEKHCILCYIF